MNIFVCGDSFCFYRDNPDTDWPLILSNLAGLNLTGMGFPGQSWWVVRKFLLSYKNTEDYEKTKVFVICHTEPNRMLIDQVPPGIENGKLHDLYLQYFHSDSISEWCNKQWYKELNEILSDKVVLHIQGFQNTDQYFNSLNGIKFTQPLIDLSLDEIGNNRQKFRIGDNRRNHFSTDNNKKLAHKFYQLIKDEIK